MFFGALLGLSGQSGAPAASELILVTWECVLTCSAPTSVQLQSTANMLRSPCGKSSGCVSTLTLLLWCFYEHLVPALHHWKGQDCFQTGFLYSAAVYSNNKSKRKSSPKHLSPLFCLHGATKMSKGQENLQYENAGTAQLGEVLFWMLSLWLMLIRSSSALSFSVRRATKV